MKNLEKIEYRNFAIGYDEHFGHPHLTFSLDAFYGKYVGSLLTSYDKFRKYLKLKHPAIENYIESIRSSIDGYGPKEKEVLKILEQENFPLEAYVTLYFEEKKEEVIEQIKQQTEYRNTRTQEDLEDKHKSYLKLKALQDESNFCYIDTNDLIENIEELCIQHRAKWFPNAMKKDSKNKQLKKQLYFHLSTLSEDLMELLYAIKQRHYRTLKK